MKKWIVALIIIGAMLSMVREVRAEQLPPYVLLNLRGHAQQMPLSCESRSAVDLAAFWGVSIPEREFFDGLPKTENPHTGFVGNVYERWGQLPPNGYGVHAEPIAELLRAYGLLAQVRYGLGLDGLRAELAAGRPVIIWATPRMATQPVETLATSDGQTVRVVRYEHTIIATGYTEEAVYVVDAGNGHRWVYDNQALLRAWDKLGQMSVLIHGRSRAPVVTAVQPATTEAPTVVTPQPATTKAPAPLSNETVTFQSPPAGGTVRVPLKIAGTVQMAGFRYYEVWYGVGDAPATWKWVSGSHRAPVENALITQEQLPWLAPGRHTIRVVVYGESREDEGRVQFTVVP